MKLPDVPFTVADWAAVAPSIHPGEAGTAQWRTIEASGLRVRVVDYSPGYRSDHFCARGHVLFVLAGELHVELRDGSHHVLRPGMSFHSGDDPRNPHCASTGTGARVFIVD